MQLGESLTATEESGMKTRLSTRKLISDMFLDGSGNWSQDEPMISMMQKWVS